MKHLTPTLKKAIEQKITECGAGIGSVGVDNRLLYCGETFRIEPVFADTFNEDGELLCRELLGYQIYKHNPYGIYDRLFAELSKDLTKSKEY